jgi:hypothetical protein
VHVTLTDFAAGLLNRYDKTSEEILSSALAELTVRERAAVTAAVPALVKLQHALAAGDSRP